MINEIPALNTSRKDRGAGYPHGTERMALLHTLCKMLRIKRNDPIVKDIWYRESWYITALIDKLVDICGRRGMRVM